MTTRYVARREPHRGAVERLLAATADSFVPPLTDAERAPVTRGNDERGRTDLAGYVDRCLRRPMVGAFDDDALVDVEADVNPEARLVAPDAPVEEAVPEAGDGTPGVDVVCGQPDGPSCPEFRQGVVVGHVVVAEREHVQ
ncbi:MAG: hypothetical protein ABEH78_10085 [Haloferacaceae archaeon]